MGLGLPNHHACIDSASTFAFGTLLCSIQVTRSAWTSPPLLASSMDPWPGLLHHMCCFIISRGWVQEHNNNDFTSKLQAGWSAAMNRVGRQCDHMCCACLLCSFEWLAPAVVLWSISVLVWPLLLRLHQPVISSICNLHAYLIGLCESIS